MAKLARRISCQHGFEPNDLCDTFPRTQQVSVCLEGTHFQYRQQE